MIIRYKRIKSQYLVVEMIADDLFPHDESLRDRFLRLLLSHPHPFDYLTLLHFGYGESDVEEYRTLLKQATGSIELIRYPAEIRKLIWEIFYGYVELPLETSPYKLYTEPANRYVVPGVYTNSTPYADYEIIVP